MNATRKLAAFAVALAAVLGGGAVAGAVLKPAAPGGKAAAKAQPASETSGSSGMNGMPNRPGSAHGSSDQHGAMGGEVRGLAIAQDGLRLVIEDPALHAGQSQQLRFQIVDDHGRAVRDFEVEHTKRMHLIVVRPTSPVFSTCIRA